jgi:hypothetical protein
LAATTGWPSTAAVPFYVVIDPGTSAEEKCSATISGSTLTLVRAQDDTTATSHSSGATIYPVFTANDADEANELVAKLTTKGDLLVTTGSALNRLAVGTNNHVLTAASGETNGLKWSAINNVSLGDVGATWTSYTPSVTNITVGNGTITGKYTVVNKTVFARVTFTLGSTSTVAIDAAISLPVTGVDGSSLSGLVGTAVYRDTSTSEFYWGWWRSLLGYEGTFGVISATHPFTWATGDIIYLQATYEAS